MKWNGSKLRELAREKDFKLQKIAESVGVSRQTVNDWIKGQIPKGNHLILLCQIFQVSPGSFFYDDSSSFISVPVHRARMGAKITVSMQKDAVSLAKEYLNLFRNFKSPAVVQQIRSNERNKDNARKVAKKLRQLSGITKSIPIDYEHAFKLAEHLGINLIFRTFPETIKSYAFYTRIYGHRIVFVNNATSIIDLVFPLLHEFVHATRDDIEISGEYEDDEDRFCDDVANFIQFPEEYVEIVYKAIKGLGPPHKIKVLKGNARLYKHSLHGMVKAIQNIHPSFNLSVGAADTNLRKEFPDVGTIMINGGEPRGYVQRLFELSKNFMNVIAEQIDHTSDRRLAEILDIENPLDAKEVKFEIKKSFTPE